MYLIQGYFVIHWRVMSILSDEVNVEFLEEFFSSIHLQIIYLRIQGLLCHVDNALVLTAPEM